MIEKLREKDAPLVTLVSIIGALDANPMSTYTRKEKENNDILETFNIKCKKFFTFEAMIFEILAYYVIQY